jgi:protein-disulfide isomerase
VSSRVKSKQANRMVREQLAAEQRRRRTIVVSVAAAAVLVIAGIVGFAVYLNQAPPATYAVPGAAAGDGRTGIPVSTGGTPVDIYLDYQCPVCKQYEQTNQSTLDSLVAKKKIALTYHPIAILDDRSNPPGYSTRAGSAAACASDGGKFLEYTKALYDKQPAEGSAGLTDDQLVSIGTGTGLGDSTFGACVRAERYSDWMAHNTDSAAGRNISSTPTVLVKGKPIDLTTAALLGAVGG